MCEQGQLLDYGICLVNAKTLAQKLGCSGSAINPQSSERTYLGFLVLILVFSSDHQNGGKS
jgi:hypothetical protein